MADDVTLEEASREQLLDVIEQQKAALDSAGQIFENMADIADDLRQELMAARRRIAELESLLEEGS